jgi:hypothetical protein
VTAVSVFHDNACGACGESFATDAEVFSHPCPASRTTTRRIGAGEYATVPNGFGGTTTRKVVTVTPATDKQAAFLRSLVAERFAAGTTVNGASLDQFTESVIAQGKTRVSAAIEKLLAMPKLAAPKAETPKAPTTKANVPAGRYAVTGEAGQTVFVKVDEGKGKWDGYTFVSLLIGSPGHLREQRLDRNASRALLAKVAVDPEAACIRFGHELETCGRCGSPLTNAESRARGIGPDCAEKGW